MKLPIIQSLWIGDPLSNLEKLCAESFLDNGHEFHLYVYDDVGGIPDGVTVKDGNEILPATRIFHNKRSSVAPFSDLFRFALLARKGGWWVDMDTICIKPFDFDDEIVFPYCRDLSVAIAPIKFPKGHFLMTELENACTHFTKPAVWDTPADRRRKRALILQKNNLPHMAFYEQLGRAIKHYQLEKHGKAPEVFMSITDVGWCLFGGNLSSRLDFHPQTYALHFTNSILTNENNLDKNAIYPDDSIYEFLKQKHGIANLPNAKTISHEYIFAMMPPLPIDVKRKAQHKRRIKVLIAIAIGFIIGLLV